MSFAARRPGSADRGGSRAGAASAAGRSTIPGSRAASTILGVVAEKAVLSRPSSGVASKPPLVERAAGLAASATPGAGARRPRPTAARDVSRAAGVSRARSPPSPAGTRGAGVVDPKSPNPRAKKTTRVARAGEDATEASAAAPPERGARRSGASGGERVADVVGESSTPDSSEESSSASSTRRTNRASSPASSPAVSSKKATTTRDEDAAACANEETRANARDGDDVREEAPKKKATDDPSPARPPWSSKPAKPSKPSEPAPAEETGGGWPPVESIAPRKKPPVPKTPTKKREKPPSNPAKTVSIEMSGGDASEAQRAKTAARKAREAEAARAKAANRLKLSKRAAELAAEATVARREAAARAERDRVAESRRVPPHVRSVLRETKIALDDASARESARAWAKFTPGQLRCQLEASKVVERRENASRFSDALKARTRKADALRPTMAYGDCTPLNAHEQKVRFLKQWSVYERTRKPADKPADPTFEYADAEAAELQLRAYGPPRDDLLREAERIMREKIDRFGSEGDAYERSAWGGSRVTREGLEATVARYLAELGEDASDKITLEWHEHLATPSMKMRRDPNNGGRGSIGVLHLPADASSHPKHFRESWIAALLDHEIGTHFVCAHNDAATGAHVRGTYGEHGGSHFSRGGTRRAVTLRQHLVTEEGLATINTHAAAGVKLLWGPALAYWTRWMGTRMGFVELFEALAPYAPSPNARWAQCYRCKRGLVDTGEKRAWAKDQCYFEGAWRLLEGREQFDFRLLHSGRIAMEEHASARSAWLKFSQSKLVERCPTVVPPFLRVPGEYEAKLEEIAVANKVPKRDDAAIRTLAGWPAHRRGQGQGGDRARANKATANAATCANAAALGAKESDRGGKAATPPRGVLTT